jgi:hypothetical protein
VQKKKEGMNKSVTQTKWKTNKNQATQDSSIQINVKRRKLT